MYFSIVYQSLTISFCLLFQSDPSSIFGDHLQRKLFPTTTYSNNSGGEPLHITDLTYDQLRNFHKTHYHPSNSWFFTYGMVNTLNRES